MTFFAHGNQGFPRRPRVFRPILQVLGVVVPTAGFTTLTLTTAGPIVRLNSTDYDTSRAFINSNWWTAAFLLVIPIFFVARAHPRLGPVAAVIATVPQFVTAHIYIDRIDRSGWGDGLESLTYLYAAGMATTFAIAVTLGVATRTQHPFRRGLQAG